MSAPFERTLHVRWSDTDANGHAKHTAYGQFAVECRLAWLAAAGVDMGWFQRAGLGPVLLEENARYLRELSLGEEVRVTLALAAASPDGGRWRIRHEVLRASGEVAARLASSGGWIDMAARRLVPAPPELLRALEGTARTEDFELLPDLRRREP